MSGIVDGDIPGPVDTLPEGTRPLIIDVYLTRRDIVARIGDYSPADPDADRGYLTHADLATLLKHRSDDDRPTGAITHDLDKADIIRRLSAAYGFEAGPDQTNLIKSQQIHILLTEATGDAPDRFQVPSDPDDPGDYVGHTFPNARKTAEATGD